LHNLCRGVIASFPPLPLPLELKTSQVCFHAINEAVIEAIAAARRAINRNVS
jgi:hypothetical protein